MKLASDKMTAALIANLFGLSLGTRPDRVHYAPFAAQLFGFLAAFFLSARNPIK